MLDARLFTPLPAEQRRRIADDFIAFALTRDGEPDRAPPHAGDTAKLLPARCATSRRRAGTARRSTPRSSRAGIAARSSLADAPPLIAWLVKVARANEGEGWGVDYLLDRGGFDGLGAGGTLQPRDFADLEETYHTRIMREIVRLFGLDYELRTPPWPIQQSVKLMARLPRGASYMLLLAGELMGTVAFAHLARQGEALLADHPAICARVRDLLDEILDRRGRPRHVPARLDARLAARRHPRLALLYAASSRRSYTNDPQATRR